MPIYDFACRSCGHRFEALVRSSEAPACPTCGSADLERLLSIPAVQSEATKQMALRAAKRRDATQQRQQTRERIEYERSHD